MENTKMHHIWCKKGDVGEYVLLPGDPGRVETIAERLEQAKPVASNREYVTYTGFLSGTKVSVTSTGIGGPSAAIAMEELAKLGVHTFIRVGTCGGIDETIPPGHLIIPTGAIRKDGTGREYLPLEFPAVADFDIVMALKQAAIKLNYPFRTGIVECKDSYYGQHEPERMPVEYKLKAEWNAWKAAGTLASEMESSTLFLVSSVLRVRCATVLLLCRNRERENYFNLEPTRVNNIGYAIDTAVEALKTIIQSDHFHKSM